MDIMFNNYQIKLRSMYLNISAVDSVFTQSVTIRRERNILFIEVNMFNFISAWIVPIQIMISDCCVTCC